MPAFFPITAKSRRFQRQETAIPDIAVRIGRIEAPGTRVELFRELNETSEPFPSYLSPIIPRSVVSVS